MTPKQTVQKWVDAFNRVDLDSLIELYAEDAVNHQVVFEPLRGKQAIRQMFAGEFAKAKMVCIVENIFEDGEWAILEWKDPLGLRGCGFFSCRQRKDRFSKRLLGSVVLAAPTGTAFAQSVIS
jgi:hypothetical protein